MPELQRWRFNLTGVVQGIGLRPLLFHLAKQNKLTGNVQNTDQNVILELQGTQNSLQSAEKALQDLFLKFGEIKIDKLNISLIAESAFKIIPSIGAGRNIGLISPDLATCDQCKQELFDANNRRYGYPFICCTACGPRYTIVQSLPYDRIHTTMQAFDLCQQCRSEYDNPEDRRFHAQTLSCWNCGPQLTLLNSQNQIVATQHDAISRTIQALKEGKIVAVKGIGGFHFMACATNVKAIEQLRIRKHRPHKPFALMVKDLNVIASFCEINQIETDILCSYTAPIVLLKLKQELNPLIAPDQNYYGVMLPYAPIHHLLLNEIPVLIATSANVKGEPICYQNEKALESLSDIADYILLHDRDILHPIEDSIIQVIQDKSRFIRRARGYIPAQFPANFSKQDYIAMGAHLKNTIAIYHNQQIQISPYIGDLTSGESIERYKGEVNRFQAVSPHANLICDQHPEYTSTIIAKEIDARTTSVQHHIAHVFAVIGEHQLEAPILGFAWDGLGLGLDGTQWGGETFLISNQNIKRVVSMLPFNLPGGEKAVTEPRRMALSLFYTLQKQHPNYVMPASIKDHFTTSELELIQRLLKTHTQSPLCSSMGRIFDAVSFLLGGPAKMTFEGQAALYLEQLACKSSDCVQRLPVHLIETAHRTLIDWRPMFLELINRINEKQKQSNLAYAFHLWCTDVALSISRKFDYKQIVLSGGVFQNRILLHSIPTLLHQQGYTVYCPENLPANDGAIAFGQLYIKGIDYECA